MGFDLRRGRGAKATGPFSELKNISPSKQARKLQK
jgi:hypothetical protein